MLEGHPDFSRETMGITVSKQVPRQMSGASAISGTRKALIFRHSRYQVPPAIAVKSEPPSRSTRCPAGTSLSPTP